jgi:transitional endoplasmic reticulum ATPase
MVEEIELRVAEIPSTRQDDVGRGIVRMDTRAMKDLGVMPGDIVEINGNRKTVTIVDTAYPSDVGLGIVRMDGLTRKNAGTTIGETIKIKKVQWAEADKVTLAPSQEGMRLQMAGNNLKNLLMGRPISKGDVIQLRSIAPKARGWGFDEFFDFFEPGFGMFGELKFVVVNTTPKGVVRVTDKTEVELLPEAVKIAEERIPEVTYEDIGGIHNQVKKIREMIELPLKHPELFERLGIDPPKGVLLHGPPGTGKTLLAKAVANESNAYFKSIAGPEVMSKFVGDAEKRIRDVFEDVEKNAPAIIFIDEIDAIAPKREETFGVEGRVVAQLLASMDGMNKRGQVVVIAATNRVNAIDPALRRSGRFDREIEIGVPDRQGRKEVLQIHTRNMPLEKDVDLNKLADITHGFVGADLEGLCKEAAMSALRRILPDLKLEEEEKIPKELLEKLIVTMNDFREALKVVEPSAMREVLVEVPKLKWEDVGDLENVKQLLREAIEWPLKYKGAFKRMGISPPKGILLYGPSGTGKTLLAKAVAAETESNFISVKGPEVLSKWVGESEKAIREIFRRAKQVAPCIVFFDEMDAIAPIRGTEVGTKVGERLVNQLLTELDGLVELRDVVIIGASNRPDILDPSLLRPGRFDRHILVPPPDEKGRLEIFKVHTKGMPLTKDVDLQALAAQTKDYTGADIEAVCREAAMAALRKNIKSKEVTMDNFQQGLKEVGPSMTDGVRKFFEKVQQGIKEKAAGKTQEISYMR